MQPQTEPIGLEVTRTGLVLSLQFNDALADNLDTPLAIRLLREAVRERDADAARWMLGIVAGTASLG